MRQIDLRPSVGIRFRWKGIQGGSTIFRMLALFSTEKDTNIGAVTVPQIQQAGRDLEHFGGRAYGTLQRPADAIVIGGGLAGMSASIALLDRGGSVVMVEKQLGRLGERAAEETQDF
eukprot:Skav213446  [mRNA]  locus=scaffold837:275637:276556:- [translate_table: standard]